MCGYDCDSCVTLLSCYHLFIQCDVIGVDHISLASTYTYLGNMGKAVGRGGAALSLWRSRFFILAVIIESTLLIIDRIVFVADPRERDALWWTGIMTFNVLPLTYHTHARPVHPSQ
jgi:hypothetical protein